MVSQSISPPLIKPDLHGKQIAQYFHIWHMDFVDERGLSKYARDRGVSFWKGHIRQLWQLKLLQADLVASPSRLRLANLIEVGKDGEGNYLYADGRQPRRRTAGWGDAVDKLPKLPSDTKLHFHPFRYYVLYHLDRVLKTHILPMQMLISTQRYSDVLENTIEHFQNWSATREFIQNIVQWNNIARLAVAAEPFTYERLFNIRRRPVHLDWETQLEHIEQHRAIVSTWYQVIGPDAIEELRQHLCEDAQMLDQNTKVHVMLRLTRGGFRLKTKGRLGGAIVLLTMAEALRRATEDFYDMELPEEDELGFGMYPKGLKRELYGADRVFDGDRRIANQYLRHLGVDHGIRVRWYVEGNTEFGALEYMLGDIGAVELVNLQGNVAAKGRKGAAFADSLRSDQKSQIFSLVLIDSDNEDYVRVVRRAAERDDICGMFFLSQPDFEFANFTIAELEGILWEIAVENGAGLEARQTLHDALDWTLDNAH